MATSRRRDRPAVGEATAVTSPARAPDPTRAPCAAPGQRADRYIAEIRRILARFGTQREIGKGISLFAPGDTSRHLYIVTRGSIDIFLPEDSERRPIASFHPGACFLFDFGGCQVAALEAAEESEVIDVPFARLKRLCGQEMELRLLLGQCHAFDLKSFLDACYPARSRFRLVHGADHGAGPLPAASGMGVPPGRGTATEFLIPLGPDEGRQSEGRKARRRPPGRRPRRAPAATGGMTDGED